MVSASASAWVRASATAWLIAAGSMRFTSSGRPVWRASTVVPDRCRRSNSVCRVPGGWVDVAWARPPNRLSTSALSAPATRSQWVPLPATPPSMARRSPTGWGANRPGTDELAATARRRPTPADRVSTRRSPLKVSVAVMRNRLATGPSVGHRFDGSNSRRLRGSRSGPGVAAARAAWPMARTVGAEASPASRNMAAARRWLGASLLAGAIMATRAGTLVSRSSSAWTRPR